MSSHMDEDYRDDPDHDEAAIETLASAITERDAKAQLRKLIATRRVAVRAIHLPFAAQQDLEDALDEAWCGAVELRNAGLPQPAVPILADSFSGKSSGARNYVKKVMGSLDAGPGTIPVVYAKLDTDGTVGSLAADILRGCGEKRPNSLSGEKRWDRARQAIRKRGVCLLILDEFQRAGRRPTISPVIAGKLLDIVDDGDCACAFLGKTTAEDVFASCPDLKNRLDSPVKMPRLRWITDSAEFMAFAEGFDQALVDADIIDLKSGLGDADTAQLLLEASNGLIGQFSRIIETAVIAITREGQRVITRQDLSDAVDDWAIANGRIGYNPFTQAREERSADKELDGAENAEPVNDEGEG
ncbi:ATP-binding protein [Qipengyuania sp. XHP0207]|uniref:ATP-binding protein n=1 Tax=Qipengyuania sp. XHP0207 TaxID=3038078 RepID=UPI00241D9D54|nr:ATP-binding protein [Qipengyuania sp. XHP0207]MDG5746884.1 ATP-binding protein [Qipengyuania sp. XHP0207]